MKEEHRSIGLAMNKYDCRLYIITAKTNMHVGSGETALGLIDNRVQRDVVSRLPNINASGLKGALREYHNFIWKDKESGQKDIETIFGTDSFAMKDQPQDKKEHKAGQFRFFNANLLSLPVRSNVRPYFHATSPEVLGELLDNMDTFGFVPPNGLKDNLNALITAYKTQGEPAPAWIFSEETGDVVLEDHDIKVEKKVLDTIDLKPVIALTGASLVLMNHKKFKEICGDYYLPLIARNNLENGRSKNLWHEQVVPRESRFYFTLLKPGKNGSADLEFKENQPVQIGGNASIGYGFTIIKEATELINKG